MHTADDLKKYANNCTDVVTIEDAWTECMLCRRRIEAGEPFLVEHAVSIGGITFCAICAAKPAFQDEVVCFGENEFSVVFNDALQSPTWTQRGPAQAFLDGLKAGTRKPEPA